MGNENSHINRYGSADKNPFWKAIFLVGFCSQKRLNLHLQLLAQNVGCYLSRSGFLLITCITPNCDQNVPKSGSETLGFWEFPTGVERGVLCLRSLKRYWFQRILSPPKRQHILTQLYQKSSECPKNSVTSHFFRGTLYLLYLWNSGMACRRIKAEKAPQKKPGTPKGSEKIKHRFPADFVCQNAAHGHRNYSTKLGSYNMNIKVRSMPGSRPLC